MLLHRICTWLIAAVWLLNGLWAKLLGGVPRHEAIVGRFFGASAAHVLTPLIGIAEIGMALWWLSGYRRRLNTTLQLLTIITMNTLETLFARDLLLWGGWNALWAALFCMLVALCGYSKTTQPTAHAVLS